VPPVRPSGKMCVMAVGIVAAVLGILIATACIMIPRMVARRNDPEDHTDALAYEEDTGRTSGEIESDNAAVREHQQDGTHRDELIG
jgi:hypothetical protein